MVLAWPVLASLRFFCLSVQGLGISGTGQSSVAVTRGKSPAVRDPAPLVLPTHDSLAKTDINTSRVF